MNVHQGRELVLAEGFEVSDSPNKGDFLRMPKHVYVEVTTLFVLYLYARQFDYTKEALYLPV